MHYKTIIFRLLEQQPQLYEQLQRERAALMTVERKAVQLKHRHAAWTEVLTQAQPDSSPNQILSAALELAVRDLEELLATEAAMTDLPAPSLEAAMEFVRRHSSPD